MKKIILASSLFIALFTVATLRAQDAMSVWTVRPLTIDGNSKDWPSFFRFYISGAKLQFDFYNDSTNLYLCVKASDVSAQARLMHSGLNIWLDPLSKKKQKEGITFPIKLDGDPGDLQRRPRANSDPGSAPSDQSRASKLRERVIFAQTSMKVTGMPAVSEPVLPLQNKYGIDIAYDWDSLSILAIEYKIPLSLILQHPVTGADLARTFSLGMDVGAQELPRQAGANDIPSQQGSGHGGGGMGGGGGHGGGGGGRGGANTTNNLANDRFSTDNTEQKVWLKVHLESKPETTDIK